VIDSATETLTRSQLASQLGKLAKGKKKTISQAERDRRRDHLKRINFNRRKDKREQEVVDQAEVERRIAEENLTQ
jgi:hypothetical protein